jgi:hypothetical protein
MKFLLVSLIAIAVLSFSLLISPQSAAQTNNFRTISQTYPNQYREDNHNWELLILIWVFGFTGIKNRNLRKRKLNSEDSSV